jgi:hypothetical protein
MLIDTIPSMPVYWPAYRPSHPSTFPGMEHTSATEPYLHSPGDSDDGRAALCLMHLSCVFARRWWLLNMLSFPLTRLTHYFWPFSLLGLIAPRPLPHPTSRERFTQR